MAVEKMHPVVVSITTSLARWVLFEARSVKSFSIDEEILGPAEQGGHLRRAESFESGKFPIINDKVLDPFCIIVFVYL